MDQSSYWLHLAQPRQRDRCLRQQRPARPHPGSTCARRPARSSRDSCSGDCRARHAQLHQRGSTRPCADRCSDVDPRTGRAAQRNSPSSACHASSTYCTSGACHTGRTCCTSIACRYGRTCCTSIACHIGSVCHPSRTIAVSMYMCSKYVCVIGVDGRGMGGGVQRSAWEWQQWACRAGLDRMAV